MSLTFFYDKYEKSLGRVITVSEWYLSKCNTFLLAKGWVLNDREDDIDQFRIYISKDTLVDTIIAKDGPIDKILANYSMDEFLEHVGGLNKNDINYIKLKIS